MAAKARIQKRLYYKIGEACKALGIQPYVLRYWETEFPALSPSKSRSGQRVYSEKELEIIRRIKQLLYDEGYTIAGAKKKLEGELASGTLGETASPANAAVSVSAHPSALPAAAAAAPAASAAVRSPNQAFAPIYPDAVPAPGAPAAPAALAASAVSTLAVSEVSSPAPPTPPSIGRPTRTAMPYETPAAADAGNGGAPPLPLIHPAPGLAATPVKAPTGASMPDGDGLPALPLEPPSAVALAGAAAFPTSTRNLAPQAGIRVPRPATTISAAEAEPVSHPSVGPLPAEPEPLAPPSPPAASSPQGHTLDTEATEQIESLRKGIRKALQAAQEILALLDASSPQ